MSLRAAVFAFWRRSNLRLSEGIASGEEHERPRKDMVQLGDFTDEQRPPTVEDVDRGTDPGDSQVHVAVTRDDRRACGFAVSVGDA